jgi:olfactory receptor
MGKFGFDNTIGLNSHLHTPMYFFLFHWVLHRPLLFFCDYSQNADELHIKEEYYLLQRVYDSAFFFFSECYMLTSMADDCYVAICNPLLYYLAMSPKVGSNAMLVSYLMAFSGAVPCWLHAETDL